MRLNIDIQVLPGMFAFALSIMHIEQGLTTSASARAEFRLMRVHRRKMATLSWSDVAVVLLLLSPSSLFFSWCNFDFFSALFFVFFFVLRHRFAHFIVLYNCIYFWKLKISGLEVSKWVANTSTSKTQWAEWKKKLYNVEMEECKSIERADIERN